MNLTGATSTTNEAVDSDVAAPEKKIITELFVEGARKGFHLGTHNIIPNVVMAYVIIQILKVSGLLEVIGTVCAPVMNFFGLPGEAATVLVSAWMGTAGGVGVTVGLFQEGLLDGSNILILTPAIFILGAQVQYIGRLLSVSQMKPKQGPVALAITVLCALLAMLTMNLLF